MLPVTKAWWAEAARRATPFFIGIGLAIGAFLLFGWDLAHHYTAYSLHSRPLYVEKFSSYAVWLAVAIAGWSVEWLRRIRSWSWQSVPATIEESSIESLHGRHSYYRLTISYAYSANGERYGGFYAERFGREAEARVMLESLPNITVFAKYKPDEPWESTLDLYGDAR